MGSRNHRKVVPGFDFAAVHRNRTGCARYGNIFTGRDILFKINISALCLRRYIFCGRQRAFRRNRSRQRRGRYIRPRRYSARKQNVACRTVPLLAAYRYHRYAAILGYHLFHRMDLAGRSPQGNILPCLNGLFIDDGTGTEKSASGFFVSFFDDRSGRVQRAFDQNITLLLKYDGTGFAVPAFFGRHIRKNG